jgi:hypothetical protein
MSLNDFRNQLRLNPPVLPDLFWLTYNSIGRAAGAAIDPNNQPLLQDWITELNNYVALNGKFTKFEVGYLPISPPPLFWDYKCKKCMSYIPAIDTTKPQCNWVNGDIGPGAWCSIWIAPSNYKAFSWPKELISGDW